MCRNVTELRGLEPVATEDEIEAAARQYVRKVSGLNKGPAASPDIFESAVAEVAATTTRLRRPATEAPAPAHRAAPQATRSPGPHPGESERLAADVEFPAHLVVGGCLEPSEDLAALPGVTPVQARTSWS